MDVYLEECVYIFDDGTNIDMVFEALEWWKVNNLKYYILSVMARDILVVPISTIALESTFNDGGRVINPYRASLSIEQPMLLCGANWVKALHELKKKTIMASVTFIL